MKQKTIVKYFTLSILLALSFNGCEYKEYSADVTIERDGAIYSAMPDEINESNNHIEFFKIILEHEFYIDENTSGELVDNEIYNFIVIIPIKSKDNLSELFSQHDKGLNITGFDWIRCSDEYRIYRNASTFTFNSTKYKDKYYHYNIYAYSPMLKELNMFDNIHDICLKYDNHEREEEYRTDYTSNMITIEAEEIKDMLDNLGIYYEDELN